MIFSNSDGAASICVMLAVLEYNVIMKLGFYLLFLLFGTFILAFSYLKVAEQR